MERSYGALPDSDPTIRKAERGVMAIYTFDFLISVSGPEGPKDEFRPVCDWEQSKSIDATVFTDPVPNLHMVGVGIFGESGALGLFRGEETLLLLGDLKEPPRCFSMRLRHNTILQLIDVRSNWRQSRTAASGPFLRPVDGAYTTAHW